MAGSELSAADPGSDSPSLVRALLAQIDDLYGVTETAAVVISDAVTRTAAAAGALLVPDGATWRVAAAVNLRPLEHRYVLSSDAWLIENVVRGQQGVVISDTDVARAALHGAPLASWRHLLAAPVPQVDGLILVARQDGAPFDTDDLETLASLADEAAPLLCTAVETRALARALRGLADDDGDVR
ncbi:MAG: hypothetical protein ACXV3V_01140 [Actinomycetes bacterium]